MNKRFVLDKMDDPQAPKIGEQGTYLYTDDAGSIHMSWDSGGSLALLPDIDQWHEVCTEEEILISLNHYGKKELDLCPRCGKENGKALSRRANITICDLCGIEEAIEETKFTSLLQHQTSKY